MSATHWLDGYAVVGTMRLCEKADCGDMEGFKQMMRQAAEHYGETHQALERSDRVINARIREKKESKADL